MKKPLFSFLSILFILPYIYGSGWVGIHSTDPVPAKVQLVSSNIDRSIIYFGVDGYNKSEVQTPRGAAYLIHLEDGTPILSAGDPDLPKLSASLIIPDEAQMLVKVVSSSFTDYEEIEIAPSKGNLSRDIDPSIIPYEYGRSYERNEFFPGKLAELREPYILRDHRGQSVIIYPFQYNPLTKTLRVYHEITVEIIKQNNNGANPLVRDADPNRVDLEFKRIYKRHFLNIGQKRYDPVDDHGNMLIISYTDFLEEVLPFAEWKRKTGIPTEIIDVASIGGSSAIKTFVENYYYDNGLTFLLLVGDAAQVPTHSTGSVSASDNSYGYITGDDSYPELFVGRFSAETPEQVATQVARSIKYEQDPVVSSDWLTKGLGIASSQGPGDDDELDYEHVRNMQLDLSSYSYTYFSELFDGSQGGEDEPGNPTPLMVSDKVNEGAGLILYTGHGSTTSWGTSGFSNSQVNTLTNTNMLPFIWSVACVNGAFTGGTCFAEAWLRATDSDGEPTGAIATLMSTISQSWDPPMEAQDEMVDILVESYTDNIRRTFGGISMNGCMQMNDTYGSGGSKETDAWTCFGDPSLVVRTALPGELTVTHNPTIFIGATDLSVTCDVEDALVAITKEGDIIGTGFVEAGMAYIQFEPLTEITTLDITVTAFNYLPYQAEIEVIPADGPYVIFDSFIIKDEAGNGNGLLDWGESVVLDLGAYNVGIEDASDVTITISSTNFYVTITDDTEYFGNIAADEIKMIENAFAFDLAANVPDQHVIMFTMSASSSGGREVWSSNFTMIANAPILDINSITISDPEGNNNDKLDPGETVQLTIDISNNGSSEAIDISGILACDEDLITIEENTLDYGAIGIGESSQQTYTVTASDIIPPGFTADFEIEIMSAEDFLGIGLFSIVVGQIPVLVIDLDVNNNSAPELVSSIENYGLSADYMTAFPDNLELYSSVFVCLGIYSNNHVLSTTQGQKLADYLTNGGSLYMEGADTWAYNDPTPVHPMFNINGVNDGSNNLYLVEGQPGTFTEDLSFSYTGENNYIDHLEPIAPAVSIFKNPNPIYNCAVAYDAGNYKTIGSSYEFGGLVDDAPSSTRDILIARYLEFFELGETSTGTLEGTITDVGSGEPIEGAEVIIGIFKAVSQANGSFSGNFPIGEWTVCASAEGYESSCDIIVIHEDSTVSHNFSLLSIISPENLTAVLEEDIVTLDWEIEDSRVFDYFCIYRNRNDDEYELISTTTETTYEDILEEAGIYSYYVTAMYDETHESLPSNIVTIEYTSTGIQNNDIVSYTTKLGNCYPNPFKGETTITFTLNADQDILIEIYKLTGQKIRTLVDKTMQQGKQEVIWNSRDDQGKRVQDGIYFYNLKAGSYSYTKKLIIIP